MSLGEPPSSRLWSDRGRGAKILAILAVAAALGALYGWQSRTLLAVWPAALAAGEAADGRELRFSLWEVASIEGPRRYTVAKVQAVPVIGDASGLAVGDTLSLVGRFDARERAVIAEIVEVHRWRRAKELLGWLGVGLAIVGAPLGFRWRERRLVQRG